MTEREVPDFEVTVRYQAPSFRVTLKGLTNHLLRAVLAGLWSTLDSADRTDFIAELAHYDCGHMDELSGLSRLITAAPGATDALTN